MKKKVFSIIGVAVFAVAMAININISANNNVGNVTLASVEALANGEVSEVYCNFSGSPWGHCYYVGGTGQGGNVFQCRSGGSECSGSFITR